MITFIYNRTTGEIMRRFIGGAKSDLVVIANGYDLADYGIAAVDPEPGHEPEDYMINTDGEPEIDPAKVDTVKDRSIDRDLVNSDVMRAFVNVLISEINILRQAAGLPDRNLSQLVAAIKNDIKK
jgi:hypothetical protein